MKKLAIFAAVLAAVGYALRGECKDGACASWCGNKRSGQDPADNNTSALNDSDASPPHADAVFSPDSNAPV